MLTPSPSPRRRRRRRRRRRTQNFRSCVSRRRSSSRSFLLLFFFASNSITFFLRMHRLHRLRQLRMHRVVLASPCMQPVQSRLYVEPERRRPPKPSTLHALALPRSIFSPKKRQIRPRGVYLGTWRYAKVPEADANAVYESRDSRGHINHHVSQADPCFYFGNQ